MHNIPNPLAAGNADFWPPKEILPVPLNEDGSYSVEPSLWAMKTEDEIIQHFAENPTQDFEIMAPEGWVLIIAYDWNAFIKTRPHLKQNGLIEKFGVDFIRDGSDVMIIFCEREGDADFECIRDMLGKSNKLVIPSLTYSIGNNEADQSDVAVEDMPYVAEPEPVPQTPFDKHSLLGSEDEMERFAVTTIALLGFVILMGQFGLIYAQPNTGKTLLTIALLMQAVEEGRLDPRLCYYINADDNNEGIRQKLQLFREMGAHTLIPGHKNFDPEKLIDLMQTMIKNGQCVGVVLILDTLKCFIDLMDKKRSTQFAKIVRQFVMAGGTFVGLAHTNKNPGGNGKPVYAGTSDFYEACDAACYVIPVETTPQGDKVVKFELFKKRGGGNRDEAYSYSGSNDVSYDQLVASVQRIDPDQMHKYEQSAQLVADQLVIDAITAILENATQQKMALAKDVSATTKAGRRQVIEILERYAGDDPTTHKWDFVVAERGAKVFALHPTPDS
jgi:AAA domain